MVVPGGSEVVGVPANGDSITHHIEETAAKIKISSKKQKKYTRMLDRGARMCPCDSDNYCHSKVKNCGYK